MVETPKPVDPMPSSMRAFNELKQLEKRNSVDQNHFSKALGQQTPEARRGSPHAFSPSGPARSGRDGHASSTLSVSKVLVHTAPLFVPCAVKCWADGLSGLGKGTWLSLLVQLASGAIIMQTLSWATARTRYGYYAGSGGGLRLRRKSYAEASKRLTRLMKLVFGRENARKASKKMRSHDECKRMADWLTEVVGVTCEADDLETKLATLEKAVGL